MWQPNSPTSEAAPELETVVAARQRSASTKIKNPGRRFASIVKVRPECVKEYKAAHADVWPEVLQQIKDCGIEDYSIFYDEGTSILFSSFKYVRYDYAADMERMRANPKVREWWKMTDSWQETMVEGATSSESGEPSWWKPVEEVFYVA
ncbi:DUF718-domain-containing protein [Sarocladium strictum]